VAALVGGSIARLTLACTSFGTTDAADGGGDEAGTDGSAGDAPAPPPGDGGCDGRCAPSVVIEGIVHPSSLAIREGRLLWTDGANVLWSCDPAACAPTPFATAGAIVARVAASNTQVGAIEATCGTTGTPQPELLFLLDGSPGMARSAPCPVDVAASPTLVFFVNRGDITPVSGTNWSISACSTTDCFDIAHDTIVSPKGQPELIAPVDDSIYVGSSAGRLLRWPVVGDAGPPEEVVPNGERFYALAATSTRVYWIGLMKTIRGCERSGCAPHEIASDTTVQQIVADATGLYWTSAATGRGDGRVAYLPNGSTTPEILVTGAIAPSSLAVDDSYVYFANASDQAGDPTKGSIVRVPKR
jgi:hypothetical protein